MWRNNTITWHMNNKKWLDSISKWWKSEYTDFFCRYYIENETTRPSRVRQSSFQDAPSNFFFQSGPSDWMSPARRVLPSCEQSEIWHRVPENGQSRIIFFALGRPPWKNPNMQSNNKAVTSPYPFFGHYGRRQSSAKSKDASQLERKMVETLENLDWKLDRKRSLIENICLTIFLPKF